eukprot:431736-Pleurochrysis_carterae.AAC.2
MLQVPRWCHTYASRQKPARYLQLRYGSGCCGDVVMAAVAATLRWRLFRLRRFRAAPRSAPSRHAAERARAVRRCAQTHAPVTKSRLKGSLVTSCLAGALTVATFRLAHLHTRFCPVTLPAAHVSAFENVGF